ncbi:MAG: hypothetical protein KUG65_07510, partial [Sphingomonadaceae bacterium]|nr:hypothetical protein [Sphingomonadaceae bacterium]
MTMFLNQIYQHARESPDNLAVINSGKEITYGEFARAIEAVRRQIARSPPPSEGIVVVITSNLYHGWVLLLALRSLGHTTVSGSSWDVIEGLDLRGVAALACFAGQTEVKDAFARARPDCPIVEVPRRLNMAGKADALPQPIEGGRFGDHILFTSGTTGTYKKLRLKGDKLKEWFSDLEPTILGRFGKGDFYFNYSFGPWTGAGHNVALKAWGKGAAVIFDQRPDWVEHFADYPIAMTFFVPELLGNLGAKRDLQSANYSG